MGFSVQPGRVRRKVGSIGLHGVGSLEFVPGLGASSGTRFPGVIACLRMACGRARRRIGAAENRFEKAPSE